MTIYQIIYHTWAGGCFSCEWKRNMKDASKEKTRLLRDFKENIRSIDIIKHEDVPRNKDGFIRLLTQSTQGHLELMADLKDAEDYLKNAED